MVENVQCPVCTLFLHAGMNLSDHLETHPKEQVIKALVQLTITGGKIGGALSLDLADEKKPDTESISKVARDREHELSTNSTSNSSSSLPSNSSSINSLNLSFCSIPKQPNSTSTTLATTGKHIFNQQNVTSSPAYQKSGGGSNTTSSISEVSHMPTDFSSFANRHQQSQPPSSQLHNQQHTHVAAPNQNPPPSSQQVPQLSSSTAHGFHSISQQQTPLLAHQHQNHTTAHQQLQNRPQHQLSVSQQQNLKIIYSSTLPPPPPLQLFTYQPPSQPQHQKPPPAYGTAISQIRSQHNQNKQSINQQLHRTTAVTTTTAPTLTATTAVALTSAASTSVGLSAVASSSKQLIAKPNVIPENQSTIHQKQYQPHQQTETLHQSPSQFSKTGVANTSSSLQKSGTYQPRAQPPPSPSSAAAASSRQSSSPYPTILSAAMASPSSSSSVLRYAESPVTAHYLERDNGDFIVQETPKHIVECVEKDNGEFSVIERIYQSPPSVLHIHDDDDEDDTKEVSNEETGKINIEKQKSVEIPDEEEFMSVDGDSDLEETTSEKSLPGVSGKLSKDNFNSKLTLEAPTTSTSVQKGTSLTSTTTTSNTSSNNSSNNSNNTTRKKSSKNTITVLSDVQLNLNEYLDLVGNIIASSKIAQNRKTFSAAAPIPLLKVEKVEPLDDYEAFEQFESIEDKSSKNRETEATCLPEPPSTTNNKNTETDELVANNHSNKFTLQPSPLEKTANESNLNEENVATKYPSHATSVIRMATTTSQQQLLEAEELSVEENVENLENVNGSEEKLGKDAIVVEDLSHIKTEITIEATQLQPIVIPPLKRGPKKLVIKPKSTKTDNNRSTVPTKTVSEVLCDETPTTSAKAQKQLNEKGRELHSEEKTKQQIDIPSKNVIIKSEPNVGVESRILEQHLKTSGPLLELKKEKSSSRVELNSQEESQKFNIKYESDEFVYVPKTPKEPREGPARITMQNVAEDARVLLEFANSKKTTIASSNAMTFPSSNSIFAGSSIEKSNSANATCSSSSSSTTASTSVASSNALATLRCDDEFIVPDASEVVQEIVISSTYSSQSASDAALNNCNEVSQPHHQNNFSDYPFSFLYGGGSVAQQIETKGNFSPIYQQQPHDATTAATLASGSNSTTIEEFSSVHNHQNQQRYHSAPAGAAQWYHAVSTSNTDFEAALAVDCSGTEGDVGKYLDLDSCKRANMTGSQAAPSSTSSSFTAATESSLPGCTTDALNIRTDEKMPAKGEISEQESNCDIENSWSQPMYGDIPARFFKTSFPGLFPQENGWNNEEYFTVHDLSASAGAVNGTNNRTTKSFDFRLPLESSSTSTAPAGILHQNQQHIDTLPSTSKKKRKRDLNADKSPTTTRAIAATVTSQELLQQPQQQQQLLHIYHQQPTTSAAVLAGPSTAAAASQAAASSFNITIQKQRKKVYQCVHCPAEFSKLKDRNSHMIVKHNYVRQNRRLICVQTGATTDTTSVVDLAAPSGSNILTMPQHNGESVEDSKHGIVKIELDSSEQALTAITNASPDENITAKSELMDEKESLALVPTSSSSAVVDSKPLNIRPLSLTHATKLATLYRMLVSFNISTLKQNQNFSETDVKLMESSIFFCYICRQNFSTVKLYDAHLTEHPAECFTCGKKFNRWKNFSLHLKRHLGWKEFGCNVCDKKFVVRSALVEHMRMHTGQTPLKCKICGKHFKRYSNLTQHRKRHGKQIIRKKEFVCHCGEVLPSKARFLWHKETHDAKPKCCPYCCDRFVHANSLRRHIRLAHSDKFDYTEPMECPMCKQVFAKSSIRAHMATHSMDTQHDCPICNKSFSTKWNLKIHSWVHANRTAKPFKCEHCPKAFVREVDFKNHMNAHKQIKPYTCEYCGCKFIRKYNYMRHRREHHGNKKFTCDLCKKSFHRHYYLIEHRRIHTGERPFQCTICGKSSTTKTNHNKHLKIHHSRDPFTVEA